LTTTLHFPYSVATRGRVVLLEESNKRVRHLVRIWSRVKSVKTISLSVFFLSIYC